MVGYEVGVRQEGQVLLRASQGSMHAGWKVCAQPVTANSWPARMVSRHTVQGEERSRVAHTLASLLGGVARDVCVSIVGCIGPPIKAATNNICPASCDE